jgi:hypothetical protein
MAYTGGGIIPKHRTVNLIEPATIQTETGPVTITLDCKVAQELDSTGRITGLVVKWPYGKVIRYEKAGRRLYKRGVEIIPGEGDR